MKIFKPLMLVGIAISLFINGCSNENGKKALSINGAGATFPYPIYAQWAHVYRRKTGVRVNYQSIGSGGGIAQIKAKTVDFGASDAPLKPKELESYGLIQFPMIIGGVVPVVNLKGFSAGELKLTPKNLADIYLGKIKSWNDPEIVKNNPERNMPEVAISAVHRADGSGTTWIFTNYLAKTSEEWAKKIGFGKAVSWPSANGVAGKGNEGVAAFVKKVNGAIGYVEFAYALQNNMSYVLLKNADGNFVAPSIRTFQAAAENADWENAKGYYMVLTNQPGENTWPITGASFILLHKEQTNFARAKAVLSFFDWAYRNGATLAVKLDYVPIPRKVIDLVENTWAQKIKVKGKAVWTTDEKTFQRKK
jgi:phosphate transport system substrate-binding protein